MKNNVEEYWIPSNIDSYLQESIDQMQDDKAIVSRADRYRYMAALHYLGYLIKRRDRAHADIPMVRRYIRKMQREDRLKNAPTVVTEVVINAIRNTIQLKHVLRRLARAEKLSNQLKFGHLIRLIEEDLFKKLYLMRSVSRQIRKGCKNEYRKNKNNTN